MKRVFVFCADFSNKHLRNQRPEDLDVPVALADFIHQLRTQEQTDDMYVLLHIHTISFSFFLLFLFF